MEDNVHWLLFHQMHEKHRVPALRMLAMVLAAPAAAFESDSIGQDCNMIYPSQCKGDFDRRFRNAKIAIMAQILYWPHTSGKRNRPFLPIPDSDGMFLTFSGTASELREKIAIAFLNKILKRYKLSNHWSPKAFPPFESPI